MKHPRQSLVEMPQDATVRCHIPIHHIHDLQFIQIWTLISTSVSISFVKSAHTSNSLLGGVFQTWVFPKIGGFPPNHPWINGFSIINHPFWGALYRGTMDQLSEGRKEQQAWTNTRKPAETAVMAQDKSMCICIHNIVWLGLYSNIGNVSIFCYFRIQKKTVNRD